MKTTFLNLRTRNILRKKSADRHSTPFSDSRSVGILFTAEDRSKLEAITAFAAKLELEGKVVSLLEFQPAKKELICSSFPALGPKQIGFWGTIDSSEAKAFMSSAFDYLFLADAEPGPVVRHLLARSGARCRVGKNSAGVQDYLDLMVEMNGNWTDILETMLQFVRKLS